MKMYMKLDTGELLTRKEMMDVYEDEYDGDDPFNTVPWYEYFEEVSLEQNPDDPPQEEPHLLSGIYDEEDLVF